MGSLVIDHHHTASIMQFLALALTLLLAVGSQARSLQADAPPTQLEQVRGALMVYLDQVKDSAQKALGTLDDTEYKMYKDKLTAGLDGMQAYIKTASETMAPMGEAVSGQVMEAVNAVRTQVNADVDELRTQLEPKRAELRAVLTKHMDEYRTKLEPLIQEYVAKHRENIDGLRAKMEPIVEEMKGRVAANVEETKTALVPIVETIRTKLTGRLEELKTMAAPYAEEYKEQMNQAVAKLRETINSGDLQGQVAPQLASLKEKVGPAAEEAKAKLMALYETISAALKQ